MRPAAALLLPFLFLSSVSSATTFPLPVESDALQRAVGWFRERLAPDGCIAAQPGGSCAHSSTRDALIAISASGEDPRAWGAPDQSPVDYLRTHRADLEAEPTGCPACKWAKAVVAIAAGSGDPRDFGDYNYVAQLDTYFDGVQFGAANQVNDDAWGLFAYLAAGDATDKVDALERFLSLRQNADGGWAWNLSPTSEAWGTATVLLALLRAGVSNDDPLLQRGFDFLKTQQRDSGLLSQDGADSSESTAIAVQAIRAAGADPTGPTWTKAGNDTITALLRLQTFSGSFRHNAQGGSEFLATTQVLPALRGVPYPLRPPLARWEMEPKEGNAGTLFRFRSMSTDPDGFVARTTWRFDDQPHGEGVEVTYRFDALGQHTVRLDIEDNDNLHRAVEGRFELTEATNDTTTPTIPVETSTPGASAPTRSESVLPLKDPNPPAAAPGFLMTLTLVVLVWWARRHT